MLGCFPLKSSFSERTATTAGWNSREDTPRSSAQPSPTVNLTREYTLAVQTDSYQEIWSKIHVHREQPGDGEEEVVLEVEAEQLQLAQVLHPNRESVQEALRLARPNTLIRLVSAYFENSEHTSHLCLLLHRCIYRARSLYAPLYDLLDALPLNSNSLSQSQCECAVDVFVQFHRLDNPFHPPHSDDFHQMRQCFSQLKQQLENCLRKSRLRIRLLRRVTTCSAFCLVACALGVAISAVAIAAHALVALVAGPFFAFPTSATSFTFTKKELHHVAQLDAAAKGTYVLNNDLDTIDRLVARLHAAVESDRLLIRLGLERGSDRYSIQEVAKQLRKNHPNFLHQLKDLEEHICLCFATVNRARSLLLQEIHLHQTRSS